MDLHQATPALTNPKMALPIWILKTPTTPQTKELGPATKPFSTQRCSKSNCQMEISGSWFSSFLSI